MPAGDPTSRAVHGTLGGGTRAVATKFLLRDHAPPQPRRSSVLAAKMGRGDGAHVAPRRAGFWPHRADAAWPVAAPPTSAGPGAGIRRPGSNAGSNAAAGTGGHSLCAGTAAAAVVADRHGGGGLAYHDHSPRERYLPRDSPGGTRYRSPRALIKTGKQTASLYFRTRTRQGRKRLEKGKAKETIKTRPQRQHPPGALQTLTNGALFLLSTSSRPPSASLPPFHRLPGCPGPIGTDAAGVGPF
jgi:hypothetical protein